MAYKAQIQATLGGGAAQTLVITNPDVTPTESANLLDDPGFEDWASATNLTEYTETANGTSTINQETSSVHSGSNAGRFDVDASNSLASIRQTVSMTQYAWFRTSIWTYASVASKTATLQMSTHTRLVNLPTGDYEQFFWTDWSPLSSLNWNYLRTSGASASIYFDDAEIVQLSNVLKLYAFHVNHGKFEVKYSRVAGTQIGVVFNADDLTNPQNYARLLDRGTGTIALETVAAGVPTIVESWTVPYSAGAPLAVCRHEDDGTLDIYYNGVLVDSGLAATGLNGTYWGVLNTHAGNTVDEASVDPRPCAV